MCVTMAPAGTGLPIECPLDAQAGMLPLMLGANTSPSGRVGMGGGGGG